ncbi:hypothetical protein Mapa_005231 [Marchantia paleacea]|nr:hypothetical protein Mapa_005231 [Marchantia paleacea]
MMLQLLKYLTAIVSLGLSYALVPAITTADSARIDGCSLSASDCMALSSLEFDGYLTFRDTSFAAMDFGHIVSAPPAAVLHPGSTRDIAKLVRSMYLSCSNASIAARGVGHSANGQAQVYNGIVIDMSDLRGSRVNVGERYVEATGGELWINVLQASLKKGLAPRSFLDYLHLTVGGTLSNGGISGQTYFWGPQISNVLQLEVVTGTGELVTCSRWTRSDLFFAVLGGLGQFGIITKARINLQPRATHVHHVHALYADFASFQRDQLRLISLKNNANAFEYVEGHLITNTDNVENGFNSVPFEGQNVNVDLLPAQGNTSILYYLELAKNYNIAVESPASVQEQVSQLLAPLEFIPSQIFTRDESFVDFLDRVHTGELRLRAAGLWEIQHPWSTLFVPGSEMATFERTVLRAIDVSTFNGPVNIFPVNRNKWDYQMSAVTPDEDIFFTVSFLNSVGAGQGPTLKTLVDRNAQTWKACERLGCKQFFPTHTTRGEWEAHFGGKWNKFVLNKMKFDPKAMLSPKQNIFTRGQTFPFLL